MLESGCPDFMRAFVMRTQIDQLKGTWWTIAYPSVTVIELVANMLGNAGWCLGVLDVLKITGPRH